jgi:hypothetical protein
VLVPLQDVHGPEVLRAKLPAGVTVLDDLGTVTCVGTGLHALIKQVFRTEDEKLADQGSKLYREHYKKHMLDHTHLYTGARDDETEALYSGRHVLRIPRVSRYPWHEQLVGYAHQRSVRVHEYAAQCDSG